MILARKMNVVALVVAMTISTANAQGFQEGVIAVERSQNPPWSYAFAFVACDGKLRLAFTQDNRLNKVRKQTADGGLFFKFNRNRYQMTFYPDGRAMRRDGSFVEWRYPDAAELAEAGIPADAFARAKAKCR